MASPTIAQVSPLDYYVNNVTDNHYGWSGPTQTFRVAGTTAHVLNLTAQGWCVLTSRPSSPPPPPPPTPLQLCSHRSLTEFAIATAAATTTTIATTTAHTTPPTALHDKWITYIPQPQAHPSRLQAWLTSPRGLAAPAHHLHAASRVVTTRVLVDLRRVKP
jgi:hypothetical protein